LKKIRAIIATKPLMVADMIPAELVVTTVPHEVLAVCWASVWKQTVAEVAV